jgi:hypothetical protein
VTRLLSSLLQLSKDLDDLGIPWALVGGLAVAARAEPRTTRDIDLAVSVSNDRQAERLIADLRVRGYELLAILEQEAVGRLATVRLAVPEAEGELVADLLFASSGVEPEIVEQADLLEIVPGMTVPVASTAHLIAVKLLAGRPQDWRDARWLLAQAGPADLEKTQEALSLITSRKFNRGKDLAAAYRELLTQGPEAFEG